MQSTSPGDLVTVAGVGPKHDGIVFDTPPPARAGAPGAGGGGQTRSGRTPGPQVAEDWHGQRAWTHRTTGK